MTTEDDPGRDEWRPWDQRAEDAPAPQAEPVPDEPLWARLEGRSCAMPSSPPPPTPRSPVAGAGRLDARCPDRPTRRYAVAPAERARRHPSRRAPAVVRAGAPSSASRSPSRSSPGLVGGVLGGLLADRGTTTTTGADPAPSPGAGATQRPSGSIANIAATATPSVVTLRVEGADGDGTGSGWVYDDRGHIVTNNHVVAGAADGGDITVVLANGQQLEASIVGRDTSYDLAVVKVDRTDLAPLALGSSDDVVVGDQVIAVGAPLGLDSTVTSGIVSALNRPVTPGRRRRPVLHQRDPDRCRDQPRQLRRPAARHAGPGDRRQLRHRAGPRLEHQRPERQHRRRLRDPERPGAPRPSKQLIETGKAVHPVIGVFLDPTYTGEGVRIADEGPERPARREPRRPGRQGRPQGR